MRRLASYAASNGATALMMSCEIPIDFCLSSEFSAIFSRAGTRAFIKISLASSFIALFDTVSSLLGVCSHKVDGAVRVWQCVQTASLPRISGGASC